MMELNARDYLEKSLQSTQELVRGFMSYSEHVSDQNLKESLQEFAVKEGYIAQGLREMMTLFDQT